MKKQELIHLHGLLAEIATHCLASSDCTFDLEKYRSLQTQPMSMDRSKTNHKTAVLVLAREIGEKLNNTHIPPAPVAN